MKYIDKVIGQNEEIVHEARLHWIIFAAPALCFVIGAIAIRAMLAEGSGPTSQAGVIGGVFLIIGALILLRTIIDYWTTEIAVTTKRVVFKRGLIARDTVEISLNRVEGIDVKQSIWGRLLNFGTVLVRGTGLGLQPMRRVADPLALRSAAFGDSSE